MDSTETRYKKGMEAFFAAMENKPTTGLIYEVKLPDAKTIDGGLSTEAGVVEKAFGFLVISRSNGDHTTTEPEELMRS